MSCAAQSAPADATSAKPGKKLIRRSSPDNSRKLRRAVQLAFAALNVWIGVQFYLFVRYYETGGATVRVERPPGVEGWLPIASLMNLKHYDEAAQALADARRVNPEHPGLQELQNTWNERTAKF